MPELDKQGNIMLVSLSNNMEMLHYLEISWINVLHIKILYAFNTAIILLAYSSCCYTKFTITAFPVIAPSWYIIMFLRVVSAIEAVSNLIVLQRRKLILSPQ